ncbi:hypothetical protein HPP92_009306 [Vanilla planifolia]|uniref:U-box domain-containing protein n=1 Tax=Vanilla planifolia TaxID=51239 RepID=A0A835V4K8_VANPL|nr:hypothetical protein HPP92_009306 [Vanilla planifolia]
MGWREERVQLRNLAINVPSFFRCPISLDVMKSPVSLSTGVTYDRSSIRRWLDAGNSTCPVTMQAVRTDDLVPNLTLQRLIHLWGTSTVSDDSFLVNRHPAAGILRDLRSPPAPASPLRHLADFLLDSDVDDFEKNRLIGEDSCAKALSDVLKKNAGQIDTLEVAVRVLSLILTTDFIEEKNKELVNSYLVSDLGAVLSALLSVLKDGTSLESRVDAATILSSILSSNPDSVVPISEQTDLIPELIRLIRPAEEVIGKGKTDRSAVDAGLACLVAISGVRRARESIVKKGIVAEATKLLTTDASATVAEKALRLLQVASGLSEGRSAICEMADECLGAVLGKMMKVGRRGTESAVLVLWSVCHHFRNKRAVKAVASANGSMTKFLLLMQSNCSPSVRHMAGDLLKIFRVNSKSRLAGYDTKTTHIMPF